MDNELWIKNSSFIIHHSLRILITGGAGFIGSHIVDLLIEKGHEVAVVDSLFHGKRENINKKAVFFQEDICSPKISSIFSKFKPDVVNHHAALISVDCSMKKSLLDSKTNVLGTINLLENSKKAKTKQFIFPSSVAVYGDPLKFPVQEDDSKNPISFYGINKLIAEHYILLYKDSFYPTIFRYGNVYGPRQDTSAEGGVVAIFIKNTLAGKKCLVYGSGWQTRDFIYVTDVTKANLAAIEKKQKGIFNISTGTEISILKLFEIIKRKTSSQAVFKFVKQREGDIEKSVLDNTKAKSIFDWKPKYELEEGIGETIRYF